MQSTRDYLLNTDFPAISRQGLATLQVNLGYTCNLSCSHCHVNAGPSRTEQMDRNTVDQVLAVVRTGGIKTLDLTGGAPEMNPHFRYLVEAARDLGVEVIDRCNLTILLEPGYEWVLPFLADNTVTVVASLPCYSEANVSAQRGKGVFDASIAALQALNRYGYGAGQRTLDLVYNPGGSFLPPPQAGLEADYKRELGDNYGVTFDSLLTLTNMPISRFGAVLLAQGEFDAYMALLKDNFATANLDSLMCKTTLSVDWRGFVYDCDFNQMLDLPLGNAGEQLISGRQRLHISDLSPHELVGRAIATGDHCYGCTAGQGSSCGGALS